MKESNPPMMKYPKVLGIHHPKTKGIFSGKVWLSNKLDGSNIRFGMLPNGRLQVGSRTRQWSIRPTVANSPKRFGDAWDLLEKNALFMDHAPNNLLFFGESEP